MCNINRVTSVTTAQCEKKRYKSQEKVTVTREIERKRKEGEKCFNRSVCQVEAATAYL